MSGWWKNSAQPTASLSCLLSRMLGSAPAPSSSRTISGVAAQPPPGAAA